MASTRNERVDPPEDRTGAGPGPGQVPTEKCGAIAVARAVLWGLIGISMGGAGGVLAGLMGFRVAAAVSTPRSPMFSSHFSTRVRLFLLEARRCYRYPERLAGPRIQQSFKDIPKPADGDGIEEGMYSSCAAIWSCVMRARGNLVRGPVEPWPRAFRPTYEYAADQLVEYTYVNSDKLERDMHRELALPERREEDGPTP